MQARSVRSPAESLVTFAAEGFSEHVSPDGTSWRVFSIKVDDDGSMLHVAQRTADRDHQQSQIVMVSLGTALLLGLATSVWLGRRVRNELEPLVQLSDAVQRHDPLQGDELPAADRDELVPIREAVMILGQRLSKLVEHERAFTAHAAHTLRTPLAGMDAQLAAAMQECTAQSLPRLNRARDALARLNLVVVALLNLFRADRSLELQRIDLAALVARWPFDGLTVKVDQRAQLEADPELLTAALFNLLDNSQRHGATNATVSAWASGREVLVQVEDDGPGIAPESIGHLQQAIDGHQASGQLGLGLTMASLVARAHNGRLRLVDREGGACVVLSFELDPGGAAHD
jgi:two-component system OmpR family sensor kinase